MCCVYVGLVHFTAYKHIPPLCLDYIHAYMLTKYQICTHQRIEGICRPPGAGAWPSIWQTTQAHKSACRSKHGFTRGQRNRRASAAAAKLGDWPKPDETSAADALLGHAFLVARGNGRTSTCRTLAVTPHYKVEMRALVSGGGWETVYDGIYYI